MAESLSFDVQTRSETGKGVARRLRTLEFPRLPGVIYGGKELPQSISLLQKDLLKALEDESLQSRVVDLNVEGQTVRVIVKDIQRHPVKKQILHADFLRVSSDQMLTLQVPLRYINEDQCQGVKQQGGELSHLESEIEIRCLPVDLPEFIEIDVAELALGESIHLSDLNLPKGVVSIALTQGEGHDLPVASVHQARTTEYEEELEAVQDAEEPDQQAEEEEEEEDKE